MLRPHPGGDLEVRAGRGACGKVRVWALVAAGALCGCTASAPFDRQAYLEATSLKIEALAVMDRATQPFARHREVVARLERSVLEAYGRARSRTHNEESARQWEILVDPQRHSLFGFLRRWEAEGQLDAEFVAEARGLVAEGFDAILALEAGRRESRGGARRGE